MAVTEQDQDLDTTPDVAPLTVLEQLQARRDALADKGARELPLIVPDYEGNLRIVCQYPKGGSDVVVAAVQRVQGKKQNEATLEANLDLIVNCCQRIEGRLPGAKWESLDPADPDGLQPLTFGPRLARLIGVDLPDTLKSPARMLARHLYSPAAFRTGVFEGDIAAINQAGELAQWLAKIEDETSDEFLGE